MEKSKNLINIGTIQQRILLIRSVKVIIDADLAAVYGVQTRRLNEQIKRNSDRFPSDFMFQLTQKEKDEVVANCDHLEKLKFSRTAEGFPLSVAQAWPGLARLGPTLGKSWPGLAWPVAKPDHVLPCEVRPGLARPGLARPGLAWLARAWQARL